jgi:hypothetical protein
MDKIILGREVYDQIMYYVNKTNFEISGLGAVEIIDGFPVVTKVYLLDQENSAAETEMDGEAITKLMYEHHISGHPGELKFWWHSHVNMSVFWSTTDMTTIGELTENGWFIHGVFNKDYDYKFAYTTNDPCPIMVDDIEMEIDENLVNSSILSILGDLAVENKKLEGEYDSEFAAKVTIKTYVPTVTDYSNFYPKHSGATTYTPDWNKEILTSGQDLYDPDEVKSTGAFTEAGFRELCAAGYSDEEIRFYNAQDAFCLDEVNELEMASWVNNT